jgi:hypothetical protein
MATNNNPQYSKGTNKAIRLIAMAAIGAILSIFMLIPLFINLYLQ